MFSELNKRTKIMIESLYKVINIKINPNNKADINIPINNIVTVVISKMLGVEVILKKFLIQKNRIILDTICYRFCMRKH